MTGDLVLFSSIFTACTSSDAIDVEIPGERHCPVEIRRAKLIYCRALCEYLLG